MQVIEFAHRLDAKIAADRVNLQNSLFISLIAGSLGVETDSTATASATSIFSMLRRQCAALVLFDQRYDQRYGLPRPNRFRCPLQIVGVMVPVNIPQRLL